MLGSTWVVNAVVLTAFLFMGLLANTLIALQTISRKWGYIFLFGVLFAGMLLPYSILSGLSGTGKTIAAAILVGLPVFFRG